MAAVSFCFCRARNDLKQLVTHTKKGGVEDSEVLLCLKEHAKKKSNSGFRTKKGLFIQDSALSDGLIGAVKKLHECGFQRVPYSPYSPGYYPI